MPPSIRAEIESPLPGIYLQQMSSPSDSKTKSLRIHFIRGGCCSTIWHHIQSLVKVIWPRIDARIVVEPFLAHHHFCRDNIVLITGKDRRWSSLSTRQT